MGTDLGWGPWSEYGAWPALALMPRLPLSHEPATATTGRLAATAGSGNARFTDSAELHAATARELSAPAAVLPATADGRLSAAADGRLPRTACGRPVTAARAVRLSATTWLSAGSAHGTDRPIRLL